MFLPLYCEYCHFPLGIPFDVPAHPTFPHHLLRVEDKTDREKPTPPPRDRLRALAVHRHQPQGLFNFLLFFAVSIQADSPRYRLKCYLTQQSLRDSGYSTLFSGLRIINTEFCTPDITTDFCTLCITNHPWFSYAGYSALPLFHLKIYTTVMRYIHRLSSPDYPDHRSSIRHCFQDTWQHHLQTLSRPNPLISGHKEYSVYLFIFSFCLSIFVVNVAIFLQISPSMSQPAPSSPTTCSKKPKKRRDTYSYFPVTVSEHRQSHVTNLKVCLFLCWF